MRQRERPEQKTMKVSRRDFLVKSVGTGTVAASITTGSSFSLASGGESSSPPAIKEASVQIKVNDRAYRLKIKSHWTLLDVLRKELGLTGTKMGCDRGNCGACTVIVEGLAVYACSLLAIGMEGKAIQTVEGLADGETLHPIQQAFSVHGGYQCGYCTSGQLMASKALLDKNPKPTQEEVRLALSGNLCRCGAYPKILESVLATAEFRRP